MNTEKIISMIDHTLLKPDAPFEAVCKDLDETATCGAASACISPWYVKAARDYIGDRACICTVVGFPSGQSTPRIKAEEAAEAAANGADEIDMVLNYAALKQGMSEYVLREIESVKRAIEGRVLKVIIETCALTDEEKAAAAQLVCDAGADYVKTSTGFASGGALIKDVRLIAQNVHSGVKIKAAGGIATLEQAEEFIKAGCSRIGSSRIIPAFLQQNKQI